MKILKYILIALFVTVMFLGFAVIVKSHFVMSDDIRLIKEQTINIVKDNYVIIEDIKVIKEQVQEITGYCFEPL